MFNKIVLGLDGSNQSMLALKFSANLSQTFNAKLIIVHAYPFTSDLRNYKEYDKLLVQRQAAGLEFFAQARKSIGNLSIEIEDDLLEGPAAEAIISVAESREADLIVLGTRGMGPFKGLLLGSVSTKVMQRAPCPVMVVP
ncbi:MAG: universal stress protein [Deltaproteobacteria bacterium]|nr:MAG: universal stress protein [Deltaproteobacteria bacterium]